jgi:hypothetical protein
MMGEEYKLCVLSKSSLNDEHFPTFSFTELFNPFVMKSIVVLLFFFNLVLAPVYGFFEP